MKKRYISHLEISGGIILAEYTAKGRCRHLTDLWLRLRLFVICLRRISLSQSRPFRLSKSLRASLTMACTLGRNLRHPEASSPMPTTSVGKDGDRGPSPFSGDTST